jgi:hypothetical protein
MPLKNRENKEEAIGYPDEGVSLLCLFGRKHDLPKPLGA